MSFPSKFSNSKPVTSQLGQQLTIAEVADLMGVSDSTIRKWISKGQLRAYRYGPRMIRIDEKDVINMREQIAPTTFKHVNGGGQ